MNESNKSKPISVTVKSACELVGIGPTKLYELIGSGQLKTVTIGRRRLIQYASLEELANGGVKP